MGHISLACTKGQSARAAQLTPIDLADSTPYFVEYPTSKASSYQLPMLNQQQSSSPTPLALGALGQAWTHVAAVNRNNYSRPTPEMPL